MTHCRFIVVKRSCCRCRPGTVGRGPMSKYAESTGQNQWTGGERIIPLSLEAAQEWAEKHLDGDEYEEIFGAVEEDESKKVVTFSLPESIIELIKQGSQAKKMTLSDYVAEAVKAYAGKE